MSWFAKSLSCTGSVFFPGTLPPSPADLKYITAQGIRIVTARKAANAHWGFDVEHPEWGKATLWAFRKAQAPPSELIRFAQGLSAAERNAAATAGSIVSVQVQGEAKSLLRDRKCLLFFLHALLGKDGVMAADHASQRIWSRQMLADELSHTADVDISALYTVHLVTDRQSGGQWLHTHGLAEIGGFDFDILNVPPGFTNRGDDLLRSVAFAIVEGTARLGGLCNGIAPFGIWFVPVTEFHARAAAEHQGWRDPDEFHSQNRAVLCEPSGGFLGFGRRPVPVRAFMQEIPDDFLVFFSKSATELFTARAQHTYPLFCRLVGQLAGHDFPMIAKLGYEVDGAKKSNDCEHMWFSVHAADADGIDATLESSPRFIARMHLGERSRHDPQRLSEWMVLTPQGAITPRSLGPYRALIQDL